MRDALVEFKKSYGSDNIAAAELGAGHGLNASGYYEEIKFSKLYLIENGGTTLMVTVSVTDFAQ